MVWDDESIKLLEKLWEKGLSTTEIAKKMNISKNSVVGKVHRLCLKARPSPIKKKEETKEQVKEKKTEKVSKKASKKEQQNTNPSEDEKLQNVKNDNISKEDSATSEKPLNTVTAKNDVSQKNLQNIKLVELDSHTCRWPIGDPRDDDFCFCGKKVRAGQTYCDEHSQVAYVKALPKK